MWKQSAKLAGTLSLFLLCYSVITAQPNRATTEVDTFDRTLESFPGTKVLNILMPKAVELNGDLTIALTVRIEPSFEEEFQYVFLKRRDGEIELIKRRSASGNVRYKVADIKETASELTLEEVAKLINVIETRSSVPPAKFKRLSEDLESAVEEHKRREADELQQNGGKRVPSNQRDGTRYVIWMGGEKQYDITALGISYKSPPQKDESPLIAWVRQLVKEM